MTDFIFYKTLNMLGQISDHNILLLLIVLVIYKCYKQKNKTSAIKLYVLLIRYLNAVKSKL